MTRIIAGDAQGTVLAVPASGTRPTSDRVRESLFGALQAGGMLADARVLDLYAGSGALGLEALSRGAASAELVDSAARAVQTARRNAAAVARAGGVAASVHRGSARSFLRADVGPFDLVFADPPYDVGDDEVAAVLAELVPRLALDAVVVVERSSHSPRPAAPAGLAHERDKRYGDTTLWWLRSAPGQRSGPAQSR